MYIPVNTMNLTVNRSKINAAKHRFVDTPKDWRRLTKLMEEVRSGSFTRLSNIHILTFIWLRPSTQAAIRCANNVMTGGGWLHRAQSAELLRSFKADKVADKVTALLLILINLT